MPQTRPNQGQAPINSDTFNLTGDWASTVDSLQVVVAVANDAAGDTVATDRAAAGFAVSDARPLFVYNTTTKTIRVKDSGGWRELSSQIKHAEYTHASVSQTTDAGAAFGAATVDATKTINNTFSSGVAGGVNLTEVGMYQLDFWVLGASSLGSTVHLWALAGGDTVHSTKHSSYGGNGLTGTFQLYVATPTVTVSCGVTGSSTFDFTGRIKVTKLAG